MSCSVCGRRKVLLLQAEGDFVRAARKAVQNETAHRLQILEVARANRDRVKQALADHLAECEAIA